MLFRLLLTVLFTCFTVALQAQDSVLVHVQNKENGDIPDVAYINLYAKENKLKQSVLADENGNAFLQLDSLSSRLEVIATGYAYYTQSISYGRKKPVNIILEKRVSSLEEVVVTGMAAPAKLQDALSNYQVINKVAMHAQGAVNVRDALKNQLNINISQDNMLGSRINMQGMKGDKIKILIDGMPLNGRENGEIDLGQINLNNVERIEVVQGPMSVVYGTDALGGVINVITKKSKLPWQFNGGLYYETVGQYNFDLSGTYRIKDRHQISLGGGRNYFQGWKPLDSLERAFLWHPKEQYLANFAYSYTAKSSFRLDFASDFVREKLTMKDSNYIINPFVAVAKNDKYFRNTRLSNRLQLKGKLGTNGEWQSQNSYNIYYRTKNTYIKDLETLDQQLSGGEGAQDTTRFDDISLRGSYSNKLKKVSYTIGYDINLSDGTSKKISDDANSINDYAAYISSSIPFMEEKLVLQPALRYSYNTVYNAPLIPSFNALYKAGDRLQFRFSYAKGFRAPSLKELYLHFYDSNHEIEGNPNLKAEKGTHLQLSGSWTAMKKDAKFIKILVTGFYNDVYDQISLIQPDINKLLYATYTNIDRMQNTIGTFQGDAQLNNLYLQFGYSFTHILNTDSDVRPTSHQATAMIRYSIPKYGLNLTTFYKYFGKQARLLPTIDGGADFNGTMDPYSFWDASVERKFWKNRLQLIVGVKNILNTQSSPVTGGTSSGVHSGNGSGSENISMGRSIFTTLRISLQ